MPLKYAIHGDLNLVYVRYWGVTNVAETMEVFGQYSADPEYHPDQRHLVDLREVVEYERSFPELMKLQARKADTVTRSRAPTMMVYHAPTRISLTMARSILKSWDGLGAVVGRIAQSEAEALSMLGVDEENFANLRKRTA
ncbi:hypothetical protein [Pseudooceanicola sp. MF1-13]|uniref:hypothetical protein n=1 Tax=Pseudooceanicola sp. MF1-13 TaxID=3379095 RepID=UPI0038929C10